MSLPASVSEAEFLRVVTHTAKVLYKKFGAIHGTLDDFEQQVALWSLQALPKFDSARPLGSFLFSNARNRAMNALRDTVTRTDYPCARCHAGSPCGEDGQVCRKYKTWAARNKTKANVRRPAPLTEAVDVPVAGSTPDEEAATKDLYALIDRHLPVHMRADYLMMLAGEWTLVSLTRRRAVQRKIAEILSEAGVEVDGVPVDFEALVRKP